MDEQKKQIITKFTLIGLLVILILVVGTIMIKYEVEGETNLPFKLVKLMVISTADGTSNETNELSISQSNDIYIYIEKNKDYNHEAMLKSVRIENIKILKSPQKGNVVFYRPNNMEGQIYKYAEQLVIKDNITYIGDEQNDLKTLSITNQGGAIAFRASTQNIAIHMSENEIGIENDSSLLSKAGVNIEEIKYTIGFDIIMELESGVTFKGSTKIELPLEEISGERVTGIEIEGASDIVFKRTKV